MCQVITMSAAASEPVALPLQSATAPDRRDICKGTEMIVAGM